VSDNALPLPDFVNWPIFPFDGELRVKPYREHYPADRPRAGEPGGSPCPCTYKTDDDYIWVDDDWRVSSADRSGVPVQLFLETRQHVDMDELSTHLAAGLGRMIVRLDRAMQAIGGIGRVHVARWGDGGSHFHMWFYARPVGASQMLGFCLPMWAQIVPPTDDETWQRNLRIVAAALAKDGGTAKV
jgi:hypothetical protein